MRVQVIGKNLFACMWITKIEDKSSIGKKGSKVLKSLRMNYVVVKSWHRKPSEVSESARL